MPFRAASKLPLSLVIKIVPGSEALRRICQASTDRQRWLIRCEQRPPQLSIVLAITTACRIKKADNSS